jgi:hypothetical protein
MNIKNLLPILLLFVSFNFYAQGESMKEKKEQIKALKVAFITDELSLTTNEAEAFWPLYNQFEKKQNEIRHKKMKSFMDRMDNDELDKITEKEASLLLTQSENIEEELYENRKKLILSLKGVIPSIKILKLKITEENFNKKLLLQYREKRMR